MLRVSLVTYIPSTANFFNDPKSPCKKTIKEYGGPGDRSSPSLNRGPEGGGGAPLVKLLMNIIPSHSYLFCGGGGGVDEWEL